MSKEKKLVYVHWKDWPAIRLAKLQLQRTCRLHNIHFQTVTKNTNDRQLVHSIKDADYAVVWHGSYPLATWAVELRKTLGKHYCVLETGWFPQRKYWHIDPDGLCGKSSLCKGLPEVTDRDTYLFNKIREEYIKSINVVQRELTNLPSEYVLVPLQLPHDSTICFDGVYKSYESFTQHVLDKFPDQPIVIKTHPKQKNVNPDIGKRKDVFIVRDGPFTDLVPQASLVYGQTSTTLLESALLGAKVEAIGECPLKYNSHQVDKLLAVMCGRQIKRSITEDMWYHIINEIPKNPPVSNVSKKTSINVLVITPTNNRPEALCLLEKYVRRQKGVNVHWVVSEDSTNKTECHPDHHIYSDYPGERSKSFALNLLRGLQYGKDKDYDYFCVMEDDVWYDEKFLSEFISVMEADNLSMIGASRCRTYSLRHGYTHRAGKKHSSLCATIFKHDMLPHMVSLVRNMMQKNKVSFDTSAWRLFGVNKERYDFHLHVNMKDLPGTTGFFGHDQSTKKYTYTPDKDFSVLKSLVNEDAEEYIKLISL